MPTSANGYKFTLADSAPTFDRFPAHGLYSTIPNLEDASEAQSIVHYRPHIVPFLSFCFQHFNVGFWSTAAAINVHHITLNLLQLVGRQPADLVCAWARRNTKGPRNRLPEAVKFVDALTNEELQPPARGVRVSSNHKDLYYVYSRFPKLRRSYITLVDNLSDHAVGNPPEGVLWMPPFFFLNAQDTVLDVLLRRLQRLWRNRCTDKKTKRVSVHVPDSQNDVATDKSGTEGVMSPSTTKDTVANNTSTAKVNPPSTKPFLVNANDLRTCLIGVSGTNDGELYPGGYVKNGYNREYTLSARQLRLYQPVILSTNGRYIRGSVRKIDRVKGTATVRVKLPTIPPPDVAYMVEIPNTKKGKSTRKIQLSKGRRLRTKVAKPTYEDRVVPVSALIDCTDTKWMENAYGV